MDANRYAFDTAAREALYRVISARRDVRNYRSEPIPDEVLWRILEAAHQAPSVGFMQPWNFLLIRDPELRRQVHDNYVEVNRRAAEAYEADTQLRYRSLKLQGILDAPLNILITCDRTRGGPAVLGRVTMPETDLYSTCLAIENLWVGGPGRGAGYWLDEYCGARVLTAYLWLARGGGTGGLFDAGMAGGDARGADVGKSGLAPADHVGGVGV